VRVTMMGLKAFLLWFAGVLAAGTSMIQACLRGVVRGQTWRTLAPAGGRSACPPGYLPQLSTAVSKVGGLGALWYHAFA
jgi:hypothetical protein